MFNIILQYNALDFVRVLPLTTFDRNMSVHVVKGIGFVNFKSIGCID